MAGKKTIAWTLGIIVLVFISATVFNRRIDQSKLCLASTDEEALQCQPGELIYFRARTWGNDQLPTNIAAAFCDFNFPIMHTPGSVICVYTDKRTHLLE